MKPILVIGVIFSFVFVVAGCVEPQASTPFFVSTSASTLASSPTPINKENTVAATAITTPHTGDAIYAELLLRVKAADPAIDFTQFRLAFSQTSQYDPYGFGNAHLKDSMITALDDNNYKLAAELADQLLEKNYIFPEAHIVAIQAADALGQTQQAEFHRYVLRGLIDSILSSGDGKSPESAFVVVLIEEEYLIVKILNIKDAINEDSTLVVQNQHFDVFDGIDGETNKSMKVYFNIEIPFRDFFYPF
jgi:hypothetical protein